MDRKTEALELFSSGFNCSQSVIAVFCDDLSVSREVALKITTGFGGGLRNGELCGAVSGAAMVIGMKEGHYIKGDNESKSKSYRLTKEFTDEFRAVNGDIVCKKLLGYDLSKPEEYIILDEKGAFQTECPKYILSAIEILEDMICSEKL